MTNEIRICHMAKTVDGDTMMSVYAVVDNQVVGTLDVHGWHRLGGWTCWLFVHEDWRRNGIARSLLLEVDNLARLAGKKGLEIAVDVANPAAIELYESLGYVVSWQTEKELLYMSKHL